MTHVMLSGEDEGMLTVLVPVATLTAAFWTN